MRRSEQALTELLAWCYSGIWAAGAVRLGEGRLGDQNAALQALSYEADLLLGREPGEDAILQVLDRLGRAFCVSRIRVYESRPDAGGAAAASQRYQWSAPGVEPPSATTARSGMSCWGQGLARWPGRSEPGTGDPRTSARLPRL